MAVITGAYRVRLCYFCGGPTNRTDRDGYASCCPSHDDR